jgi:hypothetical protein
MRDGYVVGDDNQTRGTGQRTAAAWLKAFEASRAAGNPVVLLPYGDPDVASLVDAGEPLKSLITKSRAASEGYDLLPTGVGGQTFSNGLWLENGSARSRYLAAASNGFPSSPQDLTLVNSAAWPAASRPSLSASPVYTVLTPEGPQHAVRTVIADSALTSGGPDSETSANPIQVRQRFAAETALLATSGKGAVSVVALPPRGWDSDGRATAALQSSLSLPWITPTDVNQVVAGATTPPALKAPTAARSNPALTNGQLSGIKQLVQVNETYSDLLAVQNTPDENKRRALLRSPSNAWRGFADEAQRFTAIEIGSVNQQLAKVQLVNTSVDRGHDIKVNLAGSKGTFPLTISNGLDESVRVGIVVTSANRSDLRIAPLQTKVLARGVKATYQIKASAEQNGLIRANVQVITASGRPVGPSQELVIQAAQYGSVGWVLVGAAIALLFGTSFVRIYRRIRTERRNPSPSTAQPDPLHPEPLDRQAVVPDDADSAVPEGPESGVPEGPGSVVPDDPGAVADETLREGVGTKDG